MLCDRVCVRVIRREKGIEREKRRRQRKLESKGERKKNWGERERDRENPKNIIFCFSFIA